MLGVGADDVFVLVDCWYQTEESMPRKPGEEYHDWLHRRMQVAYTRTVSAVFNTSFTTAMAFIATAISPIMPISTFGIYAAICIILNYVMVCTVTPGAIIVYETTVKHWNCCGGFLSKKCVAEPRVHEGEVVEFVPKTDGSVEKFFKVVYIPCITNEKFGKPTALLWICACVGWGIFAMTKGFQLTPPTEQEKWFPDKHMFTGLLEDNANLFLAGVDDQYVKFSWAYGIEGVDRSENGNGKEFSRFEPNINRGTVQFNEKFDITNADTQEDFLAGCNLIRTKPCTASSCNFGYLSRDGGVTCFLEEFDAWLTTTYSETRSALDSAATTTRLLDFRENTKPNKEPLTGSWEDVIGVIDGKIKFVRILSVSSMLTLQPIDDKKEVRAVVDSVIDTLNTDHNSETTGDIITEAGIEWPWMITEQELVDGLFKGFAICFPTAFCVLLFATANVLVSLFAIGTIVFIVASVMGIVQMAGYDLGVAESIAGIIVIGFSVDYVVHMAHMYMEGGEKGALTSKDRTIYACEHMGSTVVAGAVTTGGSGAFMFACQLMFFYKMALLICMTILFSFLFTFFFFTPLLALAGPDTTLGDLAFLKNNRKMGEGDEQTSNTKAKAAGGAVVTGPTISSPPPSPTPRSTGRTSASSSNTTPPSSSASLTFSKMRRTARTWSSGEW